jgi:cobalamin biosynthesis protein CobT
MMLISRCSLYILFAHVLILFDRFVDRDTFFRFLGVSPGHSNIRARLPDLLRKPPSIFDPVSSLSTAHTLASPHVQNGSDKRKEHRAVDTRDDDFDDEDSEVEAGEDGREESEEEESEEEEEEEEEEADEDDTLVSDREDDELSDDDEDPFALDADV